MTWWLPSGGRLNRGRLASKSPHQPPHPSASALEINANGGGSFRRQPIAVHQSAGRSAPHGGRAGLFCPGAATAGVATDQRHRCTQLMGDPIRQNPLAASKEIARRSSKFRPKARAIVLKLLGVGVLLPPSGGRGIGAGSPATLLQPLPGGRNPPPSTAAAGTVSAGLSIPANAINKNWVDPLTAQHRPLKSRGTCRRPGRCSAATGLA